MPRGATFAAAARLLWLIVPIGFVLASRPATAACEADLDLTAAVEHAGRGHVASQQDKFALARAQCGGAVLGGRDNARDAARGEPAREARQLSLYPTTPAAGRGQGQGMPTPAAGIVASQPGARASSMAASATSPDGMRMRGVSGTSSPSIRGDRVGGRLAPVQRRPGVEPARTPSKTTLRVQALADTMSRAALRWHLDPLLLHAIASVESNHNVSARSLAGAIGVMQVMPDTARRFGVREPERELHDPATNIDVSAAYLSGLRSQYENNLELMLAAYNAGEGAVEKYGYRVPPYAETQNYVKRVLNLYDQLQRRIGRQAPKARATAHVGNLRVMASAPLLVRAHERAS